MRRPLAMGRRYRRSIPVPVSAEAPVRARRAGDGMQFYPVRCFVAATMGSRDERNSRIAYSTEAPTLNFRARPRTAVSDRRERVFCQYRAGHQIGSVGANPRARCSGQDGQVMPNSYADSLGITATDRRSTDGYGPARGNPSRDGRALASLSPPPSEYVLPTTDRS